MQFIDSPLLTSDRWRVARYLLAGGLNTGLGLIMIAFFMYGLSLSPEMANAVSYGVGVLTSYLLNRFVTFRSRARMIGELARFVLVYGMAFLANLAVLWFMVRQVGMHAFVAQLVAMTVFVTSAYLFQVMIVFVREP